MNVSVRAPASSVSQRLTKLHLNSAKDARVSRRTLLSLSCQSEGKDPANAKACARAANKSQKGANERAESVTAKLTAREKKKTLRMSEKGADRAVKQKGTPSKCFM